jgi:uncharacterized protein YcgI (DUF1989 family)
VNRLEPQTGAAVELAPGQQLTVIDPQGGQVSDIFAVSQADRAEVLSSGRSIDYENRLQFTAGDTLWSNRSRRMLSIVEDTCGRHDFLLTPCSQETFDILYPQLGGAPHPSCFGNLVDALGPFGVDPDHVGTTFNIFMNTWWEPSGELHIDPPTSQPGALFRVRAEMPLVVGITACSAEKSNGGVCKPINYEVSA